jgi:hypothetical protein
MAEGEERNWGECRRHAPVPYLHNPKTCAERKSERTEWPRTMDYDFCGDFKS